MEERTSYYFRFYCPFIAPHWAQCIQEAPDMCLSKAAWAGDSAVGCLLQPGAHQEAGLICQPVKVDPLQLLLGGLRLSTYLRPFVQLLSGSEEAK